MLLFCYEVNTTPNPEAGPGQTGGGPSSMIPRRSKLPGDDFYPTARDIPQRDPLPDIRSAHTRSGPHASSCPGASYWCLHASHRPVKQTHCLKQSLHVSSGLTVRVKLCEELCEEVWSFPFPLFDQQTDVSLVSFFVLSFLSQLQSFLKRLPVRRSLQIAASDTRRRLRRVTVWGSERV